MKRMTLEIYSEQNLGVITQYDAVGIECCQADDTSGGIVYIATGGCAVAECLACGKYWRFLNVPTHGIGPCISATDFPGAFDAAQLRHRGRDAGNPGELGHQSTPP